MLSPQCLRWHVVGAHKSFLRSRPVTSSHLRPSQAYDVLSMTYNKALQSTTPPCPQPRPLWAQFSYSTLVTLACLPSVECAKQMPLSGLCVYCSSAWNALAWGTCGLILSFTFLSEDFPYFSITNFSPHSDIFFLPLFCSLALNKI